MSTRTRHGALQVATDIFHDRHGKTVTLVGVIHIADQAFWDDTQHLIASLQDQDNEVHFEGTRNDVPDLIPFLPDYGRLATALGLVGQTQGLAYQESWINTDVAMSFLMAAADKNRLAKLQATDWDALTTQLEENPAIVRAFHWVLRRIHWIPRGRFTAAIPRAIILDYRNRIAHSYATGTRKDVTAVWGANHLPGIGQLLKADGYCHHARVWRTAIKPPTGKHT